MGKKASPSVKRRRSKSPARPRPPSRHGPPIRNSEEPVVSVIVPAMNERTTIGAVIRECRKVHPDTEVLVVANGSTDGTREIAEAVGARVIAVPEPLGHDVGRSIGALHARGKYLLFTDADIVIPGARLKPFIQALERGADIALNRYEGPKDRNHVHSVVLAKHALNAFLSAPGLGGVSMTAVPHAINRRALEVIGPEFLSVPPKAHAIAVFLGLRVEPVRYVEVGRSNPSKRRRKVLGKDPLEHLIVGDHLEALEWLLKRTGPRALRTDLGRKREVVSPWTARREE